MAEFATRGVGNAALTTGIIGSAGWLLNGGLGNILGGVLGGGNGYVPSENMPVTRYDSAKDQEIMKLSVANDQLKSTIYTDQKLNDFRNYVDRKFDDVNGALCQQATYNATQNAVIGCLQQQVGQIYGLTKLIIPKDSICPEYMPRYNAFVAPTQTADSGT